MKILFLSQRFLFPMDTGGKIRTGKILEQLSRAHELTVVGNFEPANDAPYLSAMQAVCSRYIPVPWREPRRGQARFYARLARNCLSRYPVTALNDYSSSLEQAVLDTLDGDDYDLAICDFVQSALVFRQVSVLPRLLFQHNVEARIFERHVNNARNWMAREFWRLQHGRMRKFEAAMVRDFDSVIAVSEADADVFRTEYGATNVHAIPTGVDLEFYVPANVAVPSSNEIVFCGSMDWLPNDDGVRFFLDTITPHLDRTVPDWRFTVIGRNPPEWLRRRAAGNERISLTGWVDDVRPFLARAALCVVPLRIGGGTRMKIYEAMAMGKAVVSTTVGAEGLEYTDGNDICIADEAEEFASAIAGLLHDHERRKDMERAARMLVEESFGWATVARRFSAICEQAVGQ